MANSELGGDHELVNFGQDDGGEDHHVDDNNDSYSHSHHGCIACGPIGFISQ